MPYVKKEVKPLEILVGNKEHLTQFFDMDNDLKPEERMLKQGYLVRPETTTNKQDKKFQPIFTYQQAINYLEKNKDRLVVTYHGPLQK